MKISDEANVISINGLKKVLLINLAVLAGFGLSGPLMVAFEISRAPEALEFPSVVSVVSPPLPAFAIGFLASLVIGKRITFRLIANFENQHLSQGIVYDNQNSIFANFGFNLGIGALIGASLFEIFYCHNDQVAEDVPEILTALFHCSSIVHSVMAVFVGIVMGLGGWVFYQVGSIEKETNQKMMVQFYSTRHWSLIGIAGVAVAVFVIGLMFFKIFTLGQS